MGHSKDIFKCPADKAVVTAGGRQVPRTRSNSMSQVFGFGEWLDKANNRGQTAWHTYAKSSQIISPVRTWVFVDEHPNSINDAAFANACTGADARTTAQVIDIPANYHNGACGFTFADGHSEIKKWLGISSGQPDTRRGLRNMPNYFTGARNLALNFPALDSWMDVRWMKDNTTEHK